MAFWIMLSEPGKCIEHAFRGQAFQESYCLSDTRVHWKFNKQVNVVWRDFQCRHLHAVFFCYCVQELFHHQTLFQFLEHFVPILRHKNEMKRVSSPVRFFIPMATYIYHVRFLLAQPVNAALTEKTKEKV